MAISRAKALESLKLFSGLNKRDREFLASHLDEFTFQPGVTLIREGDSNHTFFVVAEGEAEVSVSGERRGLMQPGDFFGEISMNYRIPATATITARSPVRAYIMSHEQFRAMQGTPEMFARLQSVMSDRLAADLMERGPV